MKKLLFLLITLVATQHICCASAGTPEESKISVQKRSFDNLLSCVIDKHEEVINSLAENKNLDSEKAKYVLAKQCKSTSTNVAKVIKVLEGEMTLCPPAPHVTSYLKKKLAHPNEINKVSEESGSFEGIDYSVRFFLTGYDPKIAQHTQLDQMSTNSATSAYITQLSADMSKKQHEAFLQDLSQAFEGNRINPSTFSKDKLHCAYIFRSFTPLKPKVPIFVGYLFLDKPVDYHRYME